MTWKIPPIAHPLTSSRRVFILVGALLGEPSVSSEGHKRGLSRESQVRVHSQKYILCFCVEIKSKIRKKWSQENHLEGCYM